MRLAMDVFGLYKRDTIIIGGDTLFYSDFSIKAVLSELVAARASMPDCSAVLCYKTDDAGAAKYGILELDEHRRVTAFLEKPGPAATTSRWACPCFYIFSPKASALVPQFLTDHASESMQARDAPGNVLRYLYPKVQTGSSDHSHLSSP